MNHQNEYNHKTMCTDYIFSHRNWYVTNRWCTKTYGFPCHLNNKYLHLMCLVIMIREFFLNLSDKEKKNQLISCDQHWPLYINWSKENVKKIDLDNEIWVRNFNLSIRLWLKTKKDTTANKKRKKLIVKCVFSNHQVPIRKIKR